ncbi:PREDICTED: uncharacterized aarF domain-containing protein kinase 1 [Tarenaya hassleriana]|uniref:uncharacterized aarF domain-containing protein kinase 1 n=1 Tax=Tarenaya hassleriana TaxID=28532 RepID=UPI00053C3295|nr:PREDICTED: uncharacterized aarF domain-containing protein kinase 1 [Tarenaya hassleriana]
MGLRRNFKFPARTKTGVLILTAAGVALTSAASTAFGGAASFSRDSPSPARHFPEKIAAVIEGVVRSSRAIYAIAFTVADYKYSLRRLPVESEEYLHRLTEVHLRSAKRILKLCEINKGFYIKAGQFVAAMKQVPKEYTLTLSSLQDQAVPCHFQPIKEVLIGNLGLSPSEIFLSFDEEPIAAASIAQVHHAVLKDHQEVAVKVQYPGLEQKMRLDTTIMSFLSKSVAKLFPDYRFDWLVTEFVKAISQELDFIQEAKNSERTAKNFKNNKMVIVPRVFWELTTNRVLTMQFCEGLKVDDVKSLKISNISPVKVANALVEVFAEMIFVHGFIHGDPHPGNILVSPRGKNGFSLVLLDHGNCKTLDEGFRWDYCQLWKALILLDSNKVQEVGEHFGVGKYAKFFPVIFTGRTSNSKSALGKGMSIQERQQLKQELKLLTMEDITSFMESLPPDFLAVLRTDGLIRSITSKLGAPHRVRLFAYAKYALYGLARRPASQTELAATSSMLSRSITYMGYLRFRLILELMDLFQGINRLKHYVHRLWERIKSIRVSRVTGMS